MKKKKTENDGGVTRREFFAKSGAGLVASELAGASSVRGPAVPPSTAASARVVPGTLALTLVDEGTGQPTPARVELLDTKGKGYTAQDALPIDGDCQDHIVAADYSFERAIGMMSKSFVCPYSRTTQFYSVGNSVFSLPSGDYQLKVRKGPEYQLQQQQIHVDEGKTVALTVKLTRWINMPEQGWYSADGHLHIARPVKELNPFLSKWMQAEDIHVANLLQWGLAARFHNALQYAFGDGGLYREGDYLLATGQENPRTHFRGHAIIYGGKTPINFPDAYLIYQLFFEEAERQGAVKGYAHFGTVNGSGYGLPINLPGRLLNFLEVLQWEHAIYDVWYDILNLGFRMTPTAGTDYPCGTLNLPGRERFYTRVEGPLSYEGWLEGVRKGRTFVTNGPMLEFRIGEKGMGDEVVLEKPGQVVLEGRVRFNLNRDIVDRLEVIVNGEPVRSYPQMVNADEIKFQLPFDVAQTTWVALRASGMKVDEQAAIGTFFNPTSLAHTAPIYLTVQGTPPLSAQPCAAPLARKWLAKLDDLEARLAEDQIARLALPAAHDEVDLEQLQRDRPALLQAIHSARKYFTKMAG